MEGRRSCKEGGRVTSVVGGCTRKAGDWLHARKPQESEADLSWPDPMTDEVAKNILAVVAK